MEGFSDAPPRQPQRALKRLQLPATGGAQAQGWGEALHVASRRGKLGPFAPRGFPLFCAWQKLGGHRASEAGSQSEGLVQTEFHSFPFPAYFLLSWAGLAKAGAPPPPVPRPLPLPRPRGLMNQAEEEGTRFHICSAWLEGVPRSPHICWSREG